MIVRLKNALFAVIHQANHTCLFDRLYNFGNRLEEPHAQPFSASSGQSSSAAFVRPGTKRPKRSAHLHGICKEPKTALTSELLMNPIIRCWAHDSHLQNTNSC